MDENGVDVVLYLHPAYGRAVKNVESFLEEVSSYQSLTTTVTSQSVSKLFDTLLRADFAPQRVQGRHRHTDS